VGIPAKPNAESGMNPNGVPGRSRTPSERSDAGTSIVQEVFVFVKRNLSGAQRRKDAASGERGAGKGAAALVPASAHSGPEREERSDQTRGSPLICRSVDSLLAFGHNWDASAIGACLF
jgi:hypothetical protein